MRTNIEIDDALMADAMRVTGASTKRDAVERALRQVVLADRQLQLIKGIRGIGWDGDLDDMRTDKLRPSVG